ncbi:hypothetical protein SOCE836_083420 [Sorangium cellulosum]|uniref:PEGA domain-containing protein n=2 Tax=Polyangiaceae TaxID=49 RepID=A0A4P2R0J6_SORCE|nr:hypothetical protein SOCE836_083420 [Sorangium cellulosum]WCQ95439.1 hypothetical protein NQZ70_08215 [Sorangium sp. Soce836]
MFLLALPLAAAASPPRPPPPPRSPRVAALVREAEAALDRLDIARARDLWAQIYELERSTVAICQLGQLDRRLGRWVDAAGELTRCVQEMRPPATAMERRLHDTRHADLAAARRQVAELRVFAPAGAAPVLVDGRIVDESGRTYVEPGQHEVTAALPDGRKARSTVRVTAGESRAVLLSPEPASLRPAAPPPARPAGAPAQPAAPPAPWLLYAGSAASGAFLVSGIVLHIVASLEDSALQAEMCKPRSTGNPKLLEELHAVEVQQHISTAALVAGTALGAATLVVAMLPSGAQIRAHSAGAEVRFSW